MANRWTPPRRSAFYKEPDVAYRRYLIVKIRDNEYAIRKDGHHIAYAKSIDAAKRDIDLIAD